MRPHTTTRDKQQGVAVILALLLTTLAITIVASLFWQQQVQVRAIENQRLQLQKQWILRGALDWASLILREDAKHSSVDSLDEPWAVPLAETRLDQYVENGQADNDIADTSLSGTISDAQARFNLNNLSTNGVVNPDAVAAFSRLLTVLQLDPALALATANMLAMTSPATSLPPAINTPASSPVTQAATSAVPNLAIPTVVSGGQQSMGYTQVEDLLAVPGFTPALLDTLRPYVVFLPGNTVININTASAQVISAILGLSLADANALVVSRNAASFRDLADFSARLPNGAFNAANISVNTGYFLVNGKVRMNRAQLDMQALIQRYGVMTQLLWIREF